MLKGLTRASLGMVERSLQDTFALGLRLTMIVLANGTVVDLQVKCRLPC